MLLPVCRGVYLAAVFYHKDSLLVTAEDQIPIVEVDDSYSSSLMQDFLWFTKVRRVVKNHVKPKRLIYDREEE